MKNWFKALNWGKIIQFLITVLTATAAVFGLSSCRAATLHQDPWHEKDPELSTPRIDNASRTVISQPTTSTIVKVPYQKGTTEVRIYKDGTLVLTDTIQAIKSGTAVYNMAAYGKAKYTYIAFKK